MRLLKFFYIIRKVILFCMVFLLSLLVFLPFLFLFSASFMDSVELNESLGAVLGMKEGFASFRLLPDYPTVKPYIELLLDTPNFFIMFWNSCIQVFPALIGQLLVSVPAAWSFARYDFFGKKLVFFFYIALMIMPFQVTMVSNYLVLDKLELMNRHLAIVLPNIFSTFPVFIMVKFFKGIPESLMEAARLDGAGEGRIFLKIGIPLGSAGILSAIILDFLEYWNAIEQPLTFLKEKALWPLSLYLPEISVDKAGVSMSASVIMLMPAILIFLLGQDYLEQGIVASGMKE